MTAAQIFYAIGALLLFGKLCRDVYVGEAFIGLGTYRRTEHPSRFWTTIALDLGLIALFGYGIAGQVT